MKKKKKNLTGVIKICCEFKANEDPTFCRISRPVKNFAVIRWLKFLLSVFIDIDSRQKKKTRKIVEEEVRN